MSRAEVKPGDVYNKWTVIQEVTSKTKHRRVLCKCECGTQRVVLLQSLRAHDTKSCGCSSAGSREAVKKRYKALWT